jgi:hypothetical protein
MRTQVLSPDGRLLAWQGWQQKLHVWDLSQKKERYQWRVGDSSGMSFSPDGTTLIFGERIEDCVLSHLYVKDLKTGKEIRRINIAGNIASTAASPNGKLWATTTFDLGVGGELRLWYADTWTTAYSAGRHEGYLMPLFSPDSRLLAVPRMHAKSFQVLEVATGKVVRQFGEMGHHAVTAAFTPDGRALAVADGNSTILVWDVTGRLKKGKLPEAELGAADLNARWADLASADAARAVDAVWTLVAAPRQSVPFLSEYLKPAVAPAEVPGLIRDLDSEEFETRDRAWRALSKLGEAADPALRAALADKLSLECKRRIEQLLDKARLPLPAGDALRGMRAVWVLESIGTPKAQQVLRRLAAGAEGARMTEDARASLLRLTKGAK